MDKLLTDHKEAMRAVLERDSLGVTEAILENMVNEAILDGWEPLGGVTTFTSNPLGSELAQAMVRRRISSDCGASCCPCVYQRAYMLSTRKSRSVTSRVPPAPC